MLPAWAEEMTDSGIKKNAVEDPVALAKRLTKEAKAKIAAKKQEATTEDPAALAKRLVAEAKAKIAAKEQEAKPKEDPAALAKRLVSEAKAKIAAQTQTAAAPPATKPAKKSSLADRAINPKALAQKLASEAKADLEAKRAKNLAKLEQKARDDQDAVSTLDAPVETVEAVEAAPAKSVPQRAAPNSPKKKATPRAAPARSLRDRAMMGKKMSAADALAAAMASEAEREPKASQKVATPPQQTPAPSPPVAQAAAEAAPPSLLRDPTALIAGLLPGANIETPIAVSNPAVFRALWQAHRARALHDKDYSRVATASVLLDAIDRIPAGQMAAAKVTMDDGTWAVWVDASRGTLLGVAAPADIFMAGL